MTLNATVTLGLAGSLCTRNRRDKTTLTARRWRSSSAWPQSSSAPRRCPRRKKWDRLRHAVVQERADTGCSAVLRSARGDRRTAEHPVSARSCTTACLSRSHFFLRGHLLGALDDCGQALDDLQRLAVSVVLSRLLRVHNDPASPSVTVAFKVIHGGAAVAWIHNRGDC